MEEQARIFSIRLPVVLLENIDKVAKEEFQISRSAFIRRIAQLYLIHHFENTGKVTGVLEFPG